MVWSSILTRCAFLGPRISCIVYRTVYVSEAWMAIQPVQHRQKKNDVSQLLSVGIYYGNARAVSALQGPSFEPCRYCNYIVTSRRYQGDFKLANVLPLLAFFACRSATGHYMQVPRTITSLSWHSCFSARRCSVPGSWTG
jgi:hypothetical protein